MFFFVISLVSIRRLTHQTNEYIIHCDRARFNSRYEIVSFMVSIVRVPAADLRIPI